MAVVDAVAVDAVAAKRWGVMGGGRRGSEPPSISMASGGAA